MKKPGSWELPLHNAAQIRMAENRQARLLLQKETAAADALSCLAGFVTTEGISPEAVSGKGAYRQQAPRNQELRGFV